jgi:hypothetical protein
MDDIPYRVTEAHNEPLPDKDEGNGRRLPHLGVIEHSRPDLDIIDHLAVDGGDRTTPLPFALRALVATAVNPVADAPVCIVLPDVEGIAEIVAATAALVALRDDRKHLEKAFIDEVLHPGLHLRSVREGKIIGFLSVDQDYVRLRYIDAEGSKTNATLLVPRNIVFGLEPTERKRPLFKSGEKPERPLRTPFDLVAETKTFGNTFMIRNRVILLGARQRFEDALKDVAIILARGADRHRIMAFKKFVWGYIDENRRPVVTHPYGTTGDPLVAVTQDALLLDADSPKSERILVSGRFELVRRNLEIVQRFAERNRVLVLAPAERRDEALKLRDLGWSVWEPGGSELRVDARQCVKGLPGLSRSLRSLSVDLQESAFSVVSVRSAELHDAFDHWSAISAALPAEDSEMDQRLDETRRASSELFYSMVSWLQAPDRHDIEHIHELAGVLKNHHRHAERCLGAATADRINKLLGASERFVAKLSDAKMTPKGEALLAIARRESHRTLAFVTDFVKDRDCLARFLESSGQSGYPCLTVQGLREVRQPSRIVAFGLVRRVAFARFVDPWPAREITFAGYEFESEKYEARLRQRRRMRDGLDLDEASRSRVTGLCSGDFGARKGDGAGAPSDSSRTSSQADDAALLVFDRAVGNRRSIYHRPIVNRRPGEAVVQARYMTFCGKSWAAFTEEHEVLAARGTMGAISTVTEIDVADLVPGTRIIIRESGDKDVIREMAEQEIGESSYVSLRDQASLWKLAIRQSNLGAQEISRRLARVGVNRSLSTIRGWLRSESCIGPRSKTDLLGIREAFPVNAASERLWDDCAAAVAEIRGLHLSAGAKLTDILAKQCQNVLVDAAEHEQRVELDFGAVWIVEIAETDDTRSDWPLSSVNRLNWIDRRATTAYIDGRAHGTH